MNCIGHADNAHQGNLLYLADILHWWRYCMFIYCWEGTNFHHYQLLLHQIGWYLPHALCWLWFFCVKTFLWNNQLWVQSERLIVMRSEKKWIQKRIDHPIPWWGCPSWDWMMHYKHWPIFLFPFSIRGVVAKIFLLCSSDCFYVFFEFCLYREFTVSCIVTLVSTMMSGDMVNIYSGVLFVVFCFTIIIPIFPMLCEHKLVAETLRLGYPIIVITGLAIENYAVYLSNCPWVLWLVQKVFIFNALL